MDQILSVNGPKNDVEPTYRRMFLMSHSPTIAVDVYRISSTQLVSQIDVDWWRDWRVPCLFAGCTWKEFHDPFTVSLSTTGRFAGNPIDPFCALLVQRRSFGFLTVYSLTPSRILAPEGNQPEHTPIVYLFPDPNRWIFTWYCHRRVVRIARPYDRIYRRWCLATGNQAPSSRL